MRSERVDPDGRVVVDDTTTTCETVALSDKDLRDAYERGRKDETGRHKRNWLTAILTWLLALVGLVVLVLAALNGSFARGGAVLDQQLSIAADQAEPTIRNAASEAGEAIQDARTDNNTVTTDSNTTVVQTPTGQQTTTTTTTAPEAR